MQAASRLLATLWNSIAATIQHYHDTTDDSVAFRACLLQCSDAALAVKHSYDLFASTVERQTTVDRETRLDAAVVYWLDAGASTAATSVAASKAVKALRLRGSAKLQVEQMHTMLFARLERDWTAPGTSSVTSFWPFLYTGYYVRAGQYPELPAESMSVDAVPVLQQPDDDA